MSSLIDWVSKNIVTAIGIIIILIVVWWNMQTIDKQKIDIARECNEHWQEQINTYCPAANDFGQIFNVSFGQP